jgi:hypothetical protein
MPFLVSDDKQSFQNRDTTVLLENGSAVACAPSVVRGFLA